MALEFEEVYIQNSFRSNTKMGELLSFLLQKEEHKCDHKLNLNRSPHPATTLNCHKIENQWPLLLFLKFWSKLLIRKNPPQKIQQIRIIENFNQGRIHWDDLTSYQKSIQPARKNRTCRGHQSEKNIQPLKINRRKAICSNQITVPY